MGSIPANTQLQTSLQVISSSENNPAYVELTVRTTNDTIVRTVMIFAEGMYDRSVYTVLYISPHYRSDEFFLLCQLLITLTFLCNPNSLSISLFLIKSSLGLSSY